MLMLLLLHTIYIFKRYSIALAKQEHNMHVRLVGLSVVSVLRGAEASGILIL